MTGRRRYASLAAAVACAVVAACTSGPPPPEVARTYEVEVQASRAAKDRMFRLGSASESPLLPEDKAVFSGLPYYPIDRSYRVPATLIEDDESASDIILLPTSIDTYRRMRRVGVLRFQLDGQPYTLSAFADADTRSVDRLFVPFGDLTNPDETYGGGRYLDLDRTPTGLYDLDFNRAYHPYCVYNINYECPRPPPENHLNVAVRAGERLATG